MEHVEKIKPRIGITANILRYGSVIPKRWMCHDDYRIMAFGNTPEEAYKNWKERDAKRSRVPRRGIWNIKSCRQWYFEGCPFISTYYAGLQIVGYDPQADELILRG